MIAFNWELQMKSHSRKLKMSGIRIRQPVLVNMP